MPNTSNRQSGKRFEALDGLRAIAVTGVIFYHYFYFWTPAGRGDNLVAYGDSFSWLPFVSIGYLGVNLFFVISGFVILLTLERSGSLIEFLARRANRLWPPLLLFGTLTFIIVNLFGPQSLKADWSEYIISLLILPPNHVGLLFGQGQNWSWLDGAYWSLFVEVKFYLIVGTLFFLSGKRFLSLWMGYEGLVILLSIANETIGGRALDMLSGFLFVKFIPYFSFGMASYLAYSNRKNRSVQMLAGLALAHMAFNLVLHFYHVPAQSLWANTQFLLAQTAIFILFYILAWKQLPIPMLEHPTLVKTGQASYGLYLLHQNVGITILALPFFSSYIPSFTGPLTLFIVLILITRFSFTYIETPIQKRIHSRILAYGNN